MSFLKYDKEKDKVFCLDDGFALKEVQAVWKNDKTGKEKTYFNAVITGIFWIYKPDGIYHNKSVQERIDIINKDHLKDHKWEDLILYKGVQEFIDKYENLSYTINEKLMEGIKRDAFEMLDMMNKIPANKKIRLKKGSKVKNKEGEDIEIVIDQTIEIPNMDAKKEAYENILLLSKTLKQIEANLKVERIEREKEEIERRIFDEKEKRK